MKKIADIRFYPFIQLRPKNKPGLLRIVLKSMRMDGGIRRTGYASEATWKNDLDTHLGHADIASYTPLSDQSKRDIKNVIEAALLKCHKTLPHPDLPIFIFIYPWFPSTEDSILFGGVMGLSSYYTMHIFIDADSYNLASLGQTITHEWHHLVFFRYFPEQTYELRSHILMEGAAEVFREEVVGGQPAPWSTALRHEEAIHQLKSLRPYLGVTSMKMYKNVFFGSKKYKRWTGYAIGYDLVKKFRSSHRKLAWPVLTKRIIEILPQGKEKA